MRTEYFWILYGGRGLTGNRNHCTIRASLTQYYEYNKTLVYHQRVRLHRRGGVVERVGVLRRLALQLTLVGEGTSTTITEESIMPDELDVVARVTRLDAVDADRISIGRVAGVAPVEVVHREGRVRADLVQTLTT